MVRLNLKKCLLLLNFIFCFSVVAGTAIPMQLPNLKVNATNAATDEALGFTFSTAAPKALVPPKMSTTTRGNFSSPFEGLFIFNTNGHYPEWYTGAVWRQAASQDGIETFTNKSMSGSSNTFSNIAYSSLSLTGSIVNADVSGSAAITRSKLATGTANRLVVEDGSGNLSDLGSLGTTTTLLHGNAAGAPTFGAVVLTTDVSGTLPIANGGTNNGSLGVVAGSMYYADGSKLTSMGAGTSGQVPISAGSTVVWGTPQGGLIGDREMITNTNIEVDASGYTAYADAAGALPVDCTGGSPNSTIARSTTTPITGTGELLWTKAGTANRQGEGFSIPFTVGTADQAKVLQIDFDYIVRSGTFVAGSSSADSDLEVYIYDVTNSTLIQPSTYKLYSNSTTIADHLRSNFQTSSNGTSYRLCIHQATTVTANATVGFDNISLHPSKYTFGTPITDWSSTPAVTASVGFGTVSASVIKSRRVGDTFQVTGSFTNGTVAASSANLILPITIDTAKIQTGSAVQKVGYWTQNTSGANSLITNAIQGDLFFDGSDTTHIYFATAVGSSVYTKFNVSSVFSTGIPVTFKFEVPILGASSSVQMSEVNDARIVAASIGGDAASASSGNIIIFPTRTYDTHGAYNTSTGVYTVQVPGMYTIHGTVQSGNAATGINVYIDGVSNVSLGLTDSNGEGTFTGTVQVNAGQLITLRPNATLDCETASKFYIERVSGPNAIGVTETVAARYFASATSISGSLATISWTTKDYDTHGGMSSGTYTVQAAGKYHVNCAVGIAATIVLNNQQIIEIQKNGTAVKNITHYAAGAQTNADLEISDDVQAIAGDTIRCQASSASTSPSIVSSNTKNVFSIHRVGI